MNVSLFSCSPVVRKTTIKGHFLPLSNYFRKLSPKRYFCFGNVRMDDIKATSLQRFIGQEQRIFQIGNKRKETFFCMTRMTKSIPLSLSDGEQKWRESGKMDYGLQSWVQTKTNGKKVSTMGQILFSRN